MEVREIKARARERTADQTLERAQRLAEYGGAAPVHPRSRAAQEQRAATRKISPTRIVPTNNDPEFTGAGVPMVDPDRNPFDT